MKKFIFLYFILISALAFSQNEQLAQNYFDKGEFEKALLSYQQLLKTQSGNTLYFQRIVESHQQLQQFAEAEKAIRQRLDMYKQSSLLVELGYNFHLQKNDAKAKDYYEQALEKIKDNPNDVYNVAAVFERRVLIDYALRAYKLAVTLEPRFNFNYQMAVLYGQQGNTEMMISTFLDESYSNPNSLIMVQNQLSRFMMEDGEVTFNETLRKALLIRAQKNQDIFWNEYLSWFYVQLKDYGKAFIQEKAIYKRNSSTFSNIVSLAKLALDEEETETAKEILAFVLENTSDPEVLIEANFYLIEMKVIKATEKDNKIIETELATLIEKFGVSPTTLPLQILQAHFTTFNLKNPTQGKAILKTALELPLNKYQKADLKMELADIFLFEEKFNQALLYYSQIEDDLKNHVTGHEASLKAAKTSYFKTDFEWAQQQFKVLKSASSELIANDALEYFLLLNDNKVADSTQVALKKFARADYLMYQNKVPEALAGFQLILKENKGDEIESATLLRIGKLYEKMGSYDLALNQYQEIIDHFSDGIYIDEALYFSAEIYNKHLKDAEKSKVLYEKILFSHEDSIYFIDARKKFRQLRGDTSS